MYKIFVFPHENDNKRYRYTSTSDMLVYGHNMMLSDNYDIVLVNNEVIVFTHLLNLTLCNLGYNL